MSMSIEREKLFNSIYTFSPKIIAKRNTSKSDLDNNKPNFYERIKQYNFIIIKIYLICNLVMKLKKQTI